MPVLLLLLSCAAEPCGTSAPSGSECPVDECAATCASVKAGIECCVASHGRGLEGEALDTLNSVCGDAISCDGSGLLGSEAAVCAAQVQGLPIGDSYCVAIFSPAPGVWSVYALSDLTCGEETWGSTAKIYDLDASTGLYRSESSSSIDGIGECPFP